jgi:DNA-binding NtrC family response regulator
MEAGVDREVLMTTVHSLAPDHAAQSLAPTEIVPMLIGFTVGEIEQELVLQTLARFDGNRTRAARVLGLSVRTLRNKIRQYSAEGSDVPGTRADKISLSGDRKGRDG